MTREQVTNQHIMQAEHLPADVDEEWTGYALDLVQLLQKLAFHPAMAPNLRQTYSTPATSKNKVYFMWDFVGRTMVGPILVSDHCFSGGQLTRSVRIPSTQSRPHCAT